MSAPRFGIGETQRARARLLRQHMTQAEQILWHRLRAHRFQSLGFRRQVPIGPYIADFVCHAQRLVIELDGGQHGQPEAAPRDAARDAFLAARGFRVLRFWNSDVHANLDGVLQRIGETVTNDDARRATGGADPLADHPASPLPVPPANPLPVPPPQAGEGRRAAPSWRACAVEAVAPAGLSDVLTLGHDDRYRRRGLLTTDQGEEVLLDLPEAMELPDGGALVLEDGRHVLIRAAPERLTEVRGTDPQHLLRLCWHLGNRHLPVAVGEGRLLIRHDHVIEDMLARLGARLRPVTEPFHPEGGAYGHGRTHGHSHGHDPHADPNAHIPHRHGPGHDHGHDHD